MTYDVNKLASKEQVDDKLSFDGSRDIKGVTRVFKVQSQNFHFFDSRCPHNHVTDLKLLEPPFLTLRNISIDKTLLKNRPWSTLNWKVGFFDFFDSISEKFVQI